jgi:AAHS family 4-hydroxybenzoate transporter-like MFS transporter
MVRMTSTAPRPVRGDADSLDLRTIIDGRPISGFQVRIFVLIACAVIADGFDVQAMGFVAPAIVQDWKIELSALGPIFSASLVGMFFGSICLGVAADRFGRRPVMIGAMIGFGAFTLATAFATSVTQLIGARFLAGLGLGGVMGNAVALASEFCPARRRATILMALSCGFTGGAIVGAVVSAILIPWAGWRSVFLTGGILPIVIALFMIASLPESLHFSVTRRHWSPRFAATLGSIAPGVDPGCLVAPTGRSPAPLRGLFDEGRAGATLILWVISFANMIDLFFLSNWLPTLAARMALTENAGVLLGASLQLGGIVGALAMGPLIDRYGFRWIMALAFSTACASMAFLGQTGLSLGALVLLILLTGIGVAGAQPAINTLAAALYPPSSRGAGVGWTLGVGRVGAIIGPLIAASLIKFHWSDQALFLAAAIPAACSAILIFRLPLRPGIDPKGQVPVLDGKMISTFRDTP